VPVVTQEEKKKKNFLSILVDFPEEVEAAIFFFFIH